MRSTLTLLSGVAIGALAAFVITPRHVSAANEPPTIVVAEIDVSDADHYGKDYGPKAREIIRKFGGRFLASGGAAGGTGKITALDNQSIPSTRRVVVIAFDGGLSQINAWHGDPEYQALRQKAANWATIHSVAVDGIPTDSK